MEGTDVVVAALTPVAFALALDTAAASSDRVDPPVGVLAPDATPELVFVSVLVVTPLVRDVIVEADDGIVVVLLVLLPPETVEVSVRVDDVPVAVVVDDVLSSLVVVVRDVDAFLVNELEAEASAAL